MRKVVALLVLAAVSAHAAPGPVDKEVARLRSLAKKFEERGRTGDAERQLHEALSLAPRSLVVVGDLLRLAEKRPNVFALWAHYLALRVGARPRKVSGDLLRAVEPMFRTKKIRDGVVDRLTGMAKRLRRPSEGPTARYLRDIARALDAKTAVFDKAVAACTPDGGSVLGKLERAMLKAYAAGNRVEAMRGAHILRGACVQARRTKLKVRRLQSMETTAVQLIKRIRKDAAAAKAPVTIDELKSIAKKDRPKWEEEHSDWTNPTVVLSPSGWYRIESTCGVRTTLMAAIDVEYHHRRLSVWYGKDPFEGVPGTIRLCRDPADLEGEGQPHYWAGGFQSGNITSAVVNSSSRQGLARLLTHELTHRFDGRLLPGMPAWLVEGRAVYTGGATLWPQSEKIETRAVSFGAMYRSMIRGYRSERNIKKLIEGTIDDYRDNYQAGYSLWVFLTRFAKDTYGARVPPYLKSFRAKPGWPALRRFESYFVDGKGGRPKKFAKFARQFSKYIGEGGAIDAVQWKKDWTKLSRQARAEANVLQNKLAKQAGKEELASPWDREILDKSNWHDQRSRPDDPEFGERHAYAAGLWFERNNQNDSAALAFVWARAVDELDDGQLKHVSALHTRRGKPAQAWMLRLAASGRALDRFDLGRTPAPVAQLQQVVMPLVRTFRETEVSYLARRVNRAARAIGADRTALCLAAGIKPDAIEPLNIPLGRYRLPPDCEPFVSVLDGGLVEDYWAPAESSKGAWHIGAPGLLVMGRKKPKKGETSGFARDAGVRKIFLRGTRQYRGTYTLRVRVKFISAHLSGAIVIGHTRKDRGTVISVGGGDWAYAVGRKKEGFGFPGINIGVNDLRGYDGGVSRMSRRITFRTPKTSCLLTVRVSRSFVRVFVDGEEIATHRTATNLPIEGRIGFYLGSGLVAFERPEVRRHRAVGTKATCLCEHADEPIDLAKPCRIPYLSWQGRRVLGVPRDPLGTILAVFDKRLWKDCYADAALSLWQTNLGPESEVRLRVAHPKGVEGDPVWFKKSLLPHAGFPLLHKERQVWMRQEAETRARRNKNLEKADAIRVVQADGLARPPWMAIDPRGVVRSRAIWIERGWGGVHRNLIRRLRGW